MRMTLTSPTWGLQSEKQFREVFADQLIGVNYNENVDDHGRAITINK
jgi:hypothetical protein